jgi:catechol 2,3-dioxygenase-like lactoylglutathione lyase family enzyme
MALPLLSTVHVNANCSDLARSLAFYRDVVGLTPLSHTKAVPQDGSGFGLPGRVQWDAHLLHDERGVAGPAVDLLEWQQPRPIGHPARAANQLGLYRMCLSHPDLGALHARMRSAGVRTASPPAEMTLDPESGLRVRYFCSFDPDGTCVEFIEQPGAVRLLHVNVNCRDLDRSSRWYQDVLGLAPLVARSQPGAVDGIGLGFPGACQFRADFLAIPGRMDLIVDLLEWLDPTPIGAPAASANQLGWFRLAYLVEDARACCAELDRLGVAHSGPCWLDMGPDVPIDGLHAVFFRDPDGTCLELIERPRLRNSA